MRFMKSYAKSFSLITACIFILVDVCGAAPLVRSSLPTSTEVRIPNDISHTLQIPNEIGKLEVQKDTFRDSKPFVAHIQTAHGHYEAQSNIERILKHLHDQYGFDHIFVEGAVGELDSSLLKLNKKDSESNRQILEELTKSALIKGVELFMSEYPHVIVQGIEDQASYEQNGQQFSEVIRKKNASEEFLRSMDENIERLSARYLNEALRKFTRLESQYENEKLSIEGWMQQLYKYAKKTISVDLEDPRYQVDWPMLTRFFTIQRLENERNEELLQAQSRTYLKAIQNYLSKDQYKTVEQILSTSNYSKLLPPEELSVLFEDIFKKLPSDFLHEEYPQVLSYVAMHILRGEIDLEKLLDEMSEISKSIKDSLVVNDEELSLVSVLSDYTLLNKLFSLLLTPRDYSKLQKRNEVREISPSKIAERLIDINRRGLVKDFQIAHTEELDGLFRTAHSFYKGAKVRDEDMLKRLVERAYHQKSNKYVVITGGFHAKPFEERLTNLGYGYALISPKITELDEEGHQAYIDVVLKNTSKKLSRETYEQPFYSSGLMSMAQAVVEAVRDMAKIGRIRPANKVDIESTLLKKSMRRTPKTNKKIQVAGRSELRMAISDRTLHLNFQRTESVKPVEERLTLKSVFVFDRASGLTRFKVGRVKPGHAPRDEQVVLDAIIDRTPGLNHRNVRKNMKIFSEHYDRYLKNYAFEFNKKTPGEVRARIDYSEGKVVYQKVVPAAPEIDLVEGSDFPIRLISSNNKPRILIDASILTLPEKELSALLEFSFRNFDLSKNMSAKNAYEAVITSYFHQISEHPGIGDDLLKIDPKTKQPHFVNNLASAYERLAKEHSWDTEVFLPLTDAMRDAAQDSIVKNYREYKVTKKQGDYLMGGVLHPLLGSKAGKRVSSSRTYWSRINSLLRGYKQEFLGVAIANQIFPESYRRKEIVEHEYDSLLRSEVSEVARILDVSKDNAKRILVANGYTLSRAIRYMGIEKVRPYLLLLSYDQIERDLRVIQGILRASSKKSESDVRGRKTDSQIYRVLNNESANEDYKLFFAGRMMMLLERLIPEKRIREILYGFDKNERITILSSFYHQVYGDNLTNDQWAQDLVSLLNGIEQDHGKSNIISGTFVEKTADEKKEEFGAFLGNLMLTQPYLEEKFQDSMFPLKQDQWRVRTQSGISRVVEALVYSQSGTLSHFPVRAGMAREIHGKLVGIVDVDIVGRLKNSKDNSPAAFGANIMEQIIILADREGVIQGDMNFETRAEKVLFSEDWDRMMGVSLHESVVSANKVRAAFRYFLKTENELVLSRMAQQLSGLASNSNSKPEFFNEYAWAILSKGYDMQALGKIARYLFSLDIAKTPTNLKVEQGTQKVSVLKVKLKQFHAAMLNIESHDYFNLFLEEFFSPHAGQLALSTETLMLISTYYPELKEFFVKHMDRTRLITLIRSKKTDDKVLILEGLSEETKTELLEESGAKNVQKHVRIRDVFQKATGGHVEVDDLTTLDEKVRNLYDVLKVKRGAKQAEVRRSWRLLTQGMHPDLFVDEGQKVVDQLTEQMKQINEAFEILGNIDKPGQRTEPEVILELSTSEDSGSSDEGESVEQSSAQKSDEDDAIARTEKMTRAEYNQITPNEAWLYPPKNWFDDLPVSLGGTRPDEELENRDELRTEEDDKYQRANMFAESGFENYKVEEWEGALRDFKKAETLYDEFVSLPLASTDDQENRELSKRALARIVRPKIREIEGKLREIEAVKVEEQVVEPVEDGSKEEPATASVKTPRPRKKQEIILPGSIRGALLSVGMDPDSEDEKDRKQMRYFLRLLDSGKRNEPEIIQAIRGAEDLQKTPAQLLLAVERSRMLVIHGMQAQQLALEYESYTDVSTTAANISRWAQQIYAFHRHVHIEQFYGERVGSPALDDEWNESVEKGQIARASQAHRKAFKTVVELLDIRAEIEAYDSDIAGQVAYMAKLIQLYFSLGSVGAVQLKLRQIIDAKLSEGEKFDLAYYVRTITPKRNQHSIPDGAEFDHNLDYWEIVSDFDPMLHRAATSMSSPMFDPEDVAYEGADILSEYYWPAGRHSSNLSVRRSVSNFVLPKELFRLREKEVIEMSQWFETGEFDGGSKFGSRVYRMLFGDNQEQAYFLSLVQKGELESYQDFRFGEKNDISAIDHLMQMLGQDVDKFNTFDIDEGWVFEFHRRQLDEIIHRFPHVLEDKNMKIVRHPGGVLSGLWIFQASEGDSLIFDVGYSNEFVKAPKLLYQGEMEALEFEQENIVQVLTEDDLIDVNLENTDHPYQPLWMVDSKFVEGTHVYNRLLNRNGVVNSEGLIVYEGDEEPLHDQLFNPLKSPPGILVPKIYETISRQELRVEQEDYDSAREHMDKGGELWNAAKEKAASRDFEEALEILSAAHNRMSRGFKIFNNLAENAESSVIKSMAVYARSNIETSGVLNAIEAAISGAEKSAAKVKYDREAALFALIFGFEELQVESKGADREKLADHLELPLEDLEQVVVDAVEMAKLLETVVFSEGQMFLPDAAQLEYEARLVKLGLEDRADADAEQADFQGTLVEEAQLIKDKIFNPHRIPVMLALMFSSVEKNELFYPILGDQHPLLDDAKMQDRDKALEYFHVKDEEKERVVEQAKRVAEVLERRIEIPGVEHIKVFEILEEVGLSQEDQPGTFEGRIVEEAAQLYELLFQSSGEVDSGSIDEGDSAQPGELLEMKSHDVESHSGAAGSVSAHTILESDLLSSGDVTTQGETNTAVLEVSLDEDPSSESVAIGLPVVTEGVAIDSDVVVSEGKWDKQVKISEEFFMAPNKVARLLKHYYAIIYLKEEKMAAADDQTVNKNKPWPSFEELSLVSGMNVGAATKTYRDLQEELKGSDTELLFSSHNDLVGLGDTSRLKDIENNNIKVHVERRSELRAEITDEQVSAFEILFKKTWKVSERDVQNQKMPLAEDLLSRSGFQENIQEFISLLFFDEFDTKSKRKEALVEFFDQYEILEETYDVKRMVPQFMKLDKKQFDQLVEENKNLRLLYQVPENAGFDEAQALEAKRDFIRLMDKFNVDMSKWFKRLLEKGQMFAAYIPNMGMLASPEKTSAALMETVFETFFRHKSRIRMFIQEELSAADDELKNQWIAAHNALMHSYFATAWGTLEARGALNMSGNPADDISGYLNQLIQNDYFPDELYEAAVQRYKHIDWSVLSRVQVRTMIADLLRIERHHMKMVGTRFDKSLLYGAYVFMSSSFHANVIEKFFEVKNAQLSDFVFMDYEAEFYPTEEEVLKLEAPEKIKRILGTVADGGRRIKDYFLSHEGDAAIIHFSETDKMVKRALLLQIPEADDSSSITDSFQYFLVWSPDEKEVGILKQTSSTPDWNTELGETTLVDASQIANVDGYFTIEHLGDRLRIERLVPRSAEAGALVVMPTEGVTRSELRLSKKENADFPWVFDVYYSLGYKQGEFAERAGVDYRRFRQILTASSQDPRVFEKYADDLKAIRKAAGKDIVDIRGLLGMSQGDLATDLDISVASLKWMEKGQYEDDDFLAEVVLLLLKRLKKHVFEFSEFFPNKPGKWEALAELLASDSSHLDFEKLKKWVAGDDVRISVQSLLGGKGWEQYEARKEKAEKKIDEVEKILSLAIQVRENPNGFTLEEELAELLSSAFSREDDFHDWWVSMSPIQMKNIKAAKEYYYEIRDARVALGDFGSNEGGAAIRKNTQRFREKFAEWTGLSSEKVGELLKVVSNMSVSREYEEWFDSFLEWVDGESISDFQDNAPKEIGLNLNLLGGSKEKWGVVGERRETAMFLIEALELPISQSFEGILRPKFEKFQSGHGLIIEVYSEDNLDTAKYRFLFAVVNSQGKVKRFFGAEEGKEEFMDFARKSWSATVGRGHEPRIPVILASMGLGPVDMRIWDGDYQLPIFSGDEDQRFRKAVELPSGSGSSYIQIDLPRHSVEEGDYLKPVISYESLITGNGLVTWLREDGSAVIETEFYYSESEKRVRYINRSELRAENDDERVFGTIFNVSHGTVSLDYIDKDDRDRVEGLLPPDFVIYEDKVEVVNTDLNENMTTQINEEANRLTEIYRKLKSSLQEKWDIHFDWPIAISIPVKDEENDLAAFRSIDSEKPDMFDIEMVTDITLVTSLLSKGEDSMGRVSALRTSEQKILLSFGFFIREFENFDSELNELLLEHMVASLFLEDEEWAARMAERTVEELKDPKGLFQLVDIDEVEQSPLLLEIFSTGQSRTRLQVFQRLYGSVSRAFEESPDEIEDFLEGPEIRKWLSEPVIEAILSYKQTGKIKEGLSTDELLRARRNWEIFEIVAMPFLFSMPSEETQELKQKIKNGLLPDAGGYLNEVVYGDGNQIQGHDVTILNTFEHDMSQLLKLVVQGIKSKTMLVLPDKGFLWSQLRYEYKNYEEYLASNKPLDELLEKYLVDGDLSEIQDLFLSAIDPEMPAEFSFLDEYTVERLLTVFKMIKTLGSEKVTFARMQHKDEKEEEYIKYLSETFSASDAEKLIVMKRPSELDESLNGERISLTLFKEFFGDNQVAYSRHLFLRDYGDYVVSRYLEDQTSGFYVLPQEEMPIEFQAKRVTDSISDRPMETHAHYPHGLFIEVPKRDDDDDDDGDDVDEPTPGPDNEVEQPDEPKKVLARSELRSLLDLRPLAIFTKHYRASILSELLDENPNRDRVKKLLKLLNLDGDNVFSKKHSVLADVAHTQASSLNAITLAFDQVPSFEEEDVKQAIALAQKSIGLKLNIYIPSAAHQDISKFIEYLSSQIKSGTDGKTRVHKVRNVNALYSNQMDRMLIWDRTQKRVVSESSKARFFDGEDINHMIVDANDAIRMQDKLAELFAGSYLIASTEKDLPQEVVLLSEISDRLAQMSFFKQIQEAFATSA